MSGLNIWDAGVIRAARGMERLSPGIARNIYDGKVDDIATRDISVVYSTGAVRFPTAALNDAYAEYKQSDNAVIPPEALKGITPSEIRLYAIGKDGQVSKDGAVADHYCVVAIQKSDKKDGVDNIQQLATFPQADDGKERALNFSSAVIAGQGHPVLMSDRDGSSTKDVHLPEQKFTMADRMRPQP